MEDSMITYEELVKQITTAALNADMELYMVQHKIVMPQMDREFVAQCVPEHYRSPYSTRAQISFEGIFIEIREVLLELGKLPFIKKSY
jgi:hypothetical protein